ncbi:MAG: DUF362 domain-containing protein, partial [Myxococcales bacterium]|nr:DUF362 domain-containing protein [Myxococcales bacterium]
DQINIVGDVSLAQAKDKAKGFRVGLIRVEEYFEGTNIKAHGGPPPTDGDQSYCWGGCPGALEEAIEILRLYDDATDAKLPRMHIVFGEQKAPLDVKPDELVVFLGDCARYDGPIGEQVVHIDSTYVDRSHKHPLEATAEDIFVKMIKTGSALRRPKGQQHIRITGCPVSVAEQALMLIHLGGIKNPYLDPRSAIPFASAYFSWRTHQAIRRIFGQKYNVPGPTPRGDARPAQNLPPPGRATPLEAR